MTNTNDPTIVGTYSDILTISSSTDSTTLTQSSSNSDMTLWTRKDLTDVFYRSVKYAIENEDEALKYAMTYGRDLTLEEARKFVRMYVNQDTLDFRL